MNKKKYIISGLSLLMLSGCGSLSGNNQSLDNRPSVSYSNSTLTTTDAPDIEPNTPVAKAIEFMESSNPELITENATDNKPEMVTSHIYTHPETPVVHNASFKKINKSESHKVTSNDYFFPGQPLQIKRVKSEPVVKEDLKDKPVTDSHSAFSFSD